MNTLSKKESTNIITTMGKKTDLDKALAYYKIKNKSIINQANQLGIGTIKMKITRRDGTTESKKVKPSNDPNSFYANKVREQIIKKWKNDTQEYVATYKFFFKTYNSKSKKLVDVRSQFSVIGTKDSLLLNALAEYNRRIKEYAENYPENDSYEFVDSPISVMPIPDGESRSVRSNYVESSTSGGQRKVGKRGVKRSMTMKYGYNYLKLNDDSQEWDTKQGKCVFDYLIWKYKDVEGFTKELRKKGQEYAEQFLNKLFRDEDDENELDPLTQGVSVKQLEKFCDEFSINMYAFDKNNELIEYYQCKKVIKGREALIFKVFDNHFYPVVDKTERRSLVGTATSTNPKTNDIDTFKSQKEKTKKIVIAPTEEEFEILKNDDRDYLSVQNKYALEYIKQNGGKIPFPIQPKNIHIVDATIQQLCYDDKIVITKPIDKMVERFYNTHTKIGYQGESSLKITDYIWKQKYDFDLSTAKFWSQPNGQVAEALNAEKVKWRTHLGRTTEEYTAEDIKDLLQNGKAIAMDITRCYCDAIYNQREKFIVFKGKEIVEAYDRKPLTLGLYFVETDDMTLFHKSNWYSKAIIELARKEKIPHNIILQIRCVDEDWFYRKITTDADGKENIEYELSNEKLFKDWCDDVIKLTEQDGDYSLTKQVINNITGYLGKTTTSYKNIGISRNADELWDDLVPALQENSNYNLYINSISSEESKLYLYGTEGRVNNLSNGLPMYIQVLDWSNMALYNLCKDVGGEIVYRKTDCIVSIGGKVPQEKMIQETASYAETFGKYRVEDTEKALLFNYNLLMNTNRYVEPPKLDEEWVDYPQFKSSESWEAIIKTAIQKGGMLITGRAGTGKSYVIGKGIEAELLPEESETRLAFTNRAARNIKGTTIHKVLAINKDNKTNSKTLEHLKKYKVFVVDEISMINAELWNKLMVLKKTTKATFILLGDHRQCPPIEDGKEIDYFTHPYVKRLVNYNRCELTIPQRYDMELWNWLEKFYDEGIEGKEIQKKKLRTEDILYSKNICYTNSFRCIVNHKCMGLMINKYKKTFIPLLVPEKLKDNKYADNAFIYVGLPVMAIANNRELDIINSEEFWVKEFSSSNSNMTLYRDEDETDEIVVEFKDFHKYFVVNYIATTHKSQGATINKHINIFEWERMQDDRKIGYTAVSRAKTCEQVTICSQSIRDALTD